MQLNICNGHKLKHFLLQKTTDTRTQQRLTSADQWEGSFTRGPIRKQQCTCTVAEDATNTSDQWEGSFTCSRRPIGEHNTYF